MPADSEPRSPGVSALLWNPSHRMVDCVLFVCCFVAMGTHGLAVAEEEPKSDAKAPPLVTQLLDDPNASPDLGALSDEESRKLEARKLYVIGLGQLDRRELIPARQTFEAALEKDPDNVAVLKELVTLAMQLGDTEEGLEYCRRAIQLDPDDYRMLHLLASREAEAGRLEAAVKLLEQARGIEGLLEKDPRFYLQIRSDLVQHLSTLGRVEDSIEPLKELVAIAESAEHLDIGDYARRQLARRQVLDYDQLGRALAKAGRFDEAIEVLERGRDADSRGKRLALVLAQVYFDKGEVDKASEELSHFLEEGTQNREAFELYAKIMEKRGESDQLLPKLAELLDKDGDNVALREFYTDQLIEAGRFDDAQKELTRLRGRSSSVELLAKLYRKQNDPKMLLETLSEAVRNRQARPIINQQIEAIAENPEMVKGIAQAARERENEDEATRFSENYIVAEIASKADMLDLAIEFYKRCLDIRPTLFELHVQFLEFLRTHDQNEEIVEASKRAEEAHPTRAGAFQRQYRVFALEALERFEESTALLTSMIEGEGSPDEKLSARELLTRLYLMRGDYDAAERLCKEMIDDFPDDEDTPRLRYLLASIYSQRGELDRAEKIMLDMLDHSAGLPSDLTATLNNDLGYTWADQGKNLEQAEAMIRKAIDADPERAAYLDSLGWVLFKQEQYDDAARYLEKAVETEEGKDAVIFEHLADTYIKLNKSDEARKAYEQAIELLSKSPTKKTEEQKEQIEKKMRLLLGSTP